MSPLMSLLLAAAIIVVGTALVLAWNRWSTAREADGITSFAREMRALAPDRPLQVDEPTAADEPDPPDPPSSHGDPPGGPPRSGGLTPGA